MKLLRITSAFFLALITIALMGSSVIPASYNLVQNAGSPLTRRSTLNCINGVTCADDGTNKVTTISTTAIGGNYSQSFTSQTTVVLAHNLGTNNVLVSCYDTSTPPVQIIPNTTTITDTNDVTVTFSISQSGYCVVNGINASGGGGGGTSSFPFTGFTTTTPPSSGWSFINQQSSSVTTNSSGSIYLLGTANASNSMNVYTRTLAFSAPYTITACWVTNMPSVANATVGFGLTDGTKLEAYGINAQGSGGSLSSVPFLFDGIYWTNSTTFSAFWGSNPPTPSFASNNGSLICGKVVDNSTTRVWSVSFDGANFSQQNSESDTNFLTPTGAFIFSNSSFSNLATSMTLVSWKETTP